MTELVRILTPADRAACYALWAERFGDGKAFMDWFFSARYCPDASAGLFVDGQLVSMIQGRPVTVNVRGVPVPGVMVSGVSTKVGFERRGYMHRVMALVLQHARRRGAALVYQVPEDFRVYKSLGQVPIASVRLVETRGLVDCDFCDAHPSVLHALYLRVAKGYSGMLLRDEAEFFKKMDDYATYGGRALTLFDNEAALGYAVVTNEKRITELVAENESAYRRLLDCLPKGYVAQIPEAIPLDGEVVPFLAGGVVNAPWLIENFVKRDCIIRVTDPVLRENCGTFDQHGRRVDASPDYDLTTAALVQGVVGYREIPGLFSCENCFSVDAY